MSAVYLQQIKDKIQSEGLKNEKTLRVIFPACPECGEKRNIAVNRETGLKEETHCWNLECDNEKFSLLDNIVEVTYKQEVKASK